jgi:hypothetical protein
LRIQGEQMTVFAKACRNDEREVGLVLDILSENEHYGPRRIMGELNVIIYRS